MMRVRLNKDIFITFLIMLMYSFFTIFNTNANRNYILFALAFCVLFLSKAKNFSFLIHVSDYHKSTVFFLFFCFLSMIWAYNPSYARNQAIGIFYILITLFLVYEACRSDGSVDRLIIAVEWGGIIIALYSVSVYGISGILNAVFNGSRIEDVFVNTNTIAVQCAFSVIVVFIDFLFGDRNFNKTLIKTIFCIPCILLIAASGSRKGLLILAVGFVSAFYFFILSTRSVSKRFQRIALFLIAGLSLLYFVANSALFSGVMDRMRGIGFGSHAAVEKSAVLREMMIAEGWKQFLKTPILGIGIGCPRILTMALIGADAYLHNNFVELLCGGGIVGFWLFYRMYYITYKSIMRPKNFTRNDVICLTLIIVKVVADWAMVSYYSESNYFLLMMFFLQSEICKERYINDNI